MDLRGCNLGTFEDFIAISRYNRWLPEENRRETWTETVDRYVSWLTSKIPGNSVEIQDALFDAIHEKHVMPSMRALMTAGPAADRDNTCCYNCAYIPMVDIGAFKEVMYVLMCGTGMGFSVESKHVSRLPKVPAQIERDESRLIVVEDSKEGWCAALYNLMSDLWNGIHPTWDLSNVRPEGTRLKTFGGRASGPGPLEAVFKYVTNTLYGARGRRLTTLEVHDINCVIARAIVVGGVRRSAMISLSDLGDRSMAKAKSGDWHGAYAQRALANNSAIYQGRPSFGEFLSEWKNLYESHSGERGLFNHEAACESAIKCGRDPEASYGLNPCAEIILKPYEFCNLELT